MWIDDQATRFATARGLADSRPGWLSHLDAQLMLLLLSAQRTLCSVRGLLEIGVYAGKSAVILMLAADEAESLYLCDPLLETAHTPRGDDVPPLEATAQWLRDQRPDVDVVPIAEPSAALLGLLDARPSTLRAVHIDGDHRFDAVFADLHYASQRAATAGGLIIVDDYRTAHTPGVAAAYWRWVAGLHVPHSLILSDHKAYVLLGHEWDNLVGTLPDKLTHGWLATVETIGACKLVRYARVGGA